MKGSERAVEGQWKVKEGQWEVTVGLAVEGQGKAVKGQWKSSGRAVGGHRRACRGRAPGRAGSASQPWSWRTVRSAAIEVVRAGEDNGRENSCIEGQIFRV